MPLKDVYIVAGCRTGIGAFNGQYKQIPASTLGTICIKECMRKAKLSPTEIDEVVMGQILVTGQGQNPARQASVGAGIPYEVPAYTINMLCGSGLKAVKLAFDAIQGGSANVVVCGGQENMSLAQHCALIRNGGRLGSLDLVDTILRDGLTDVFEEIHMGATAEHLARTYNVSRQEQDEFAQNSQDKAKKATENNLFKEEIVAVEQERPPASITKDEFIRMDSTVTKLNNLKPCFNKDKLATVTAGNSSGINDGAAALILCDEQTVKTKMLEPFAKILGFTQVGCQPKDMGIAPIEAINKLLNKVGWTVDDVDLFEINEAFAVQSSIIVKSLKLDSTKVNINGGAIALGHPIGASGARILVTLIHNLRRLNKQRGVAALCVGGGMGVAMAVERL